MRDLLSRPIHHAGTSSSGIGGAKRRLGTLLLLCVTHLWATEGVTQERPPSRRLGARNLVLVGGGAKVSNHRNYPRSFVPSVSFQRRILRRDVRVVPLWIRADAEYTSDRTSFRGYTVWSVRDDSPFVEDVTENMRDFTLRGELIADLLNGFGSRVNATFYAGCGVAVHQLDFNSNGRVSSIPTFRTSQTHAAFSALAGYRIDSVARRLSFYWEARYGRLYGKTHRVDTTRMPVFAEEFEFTHVLAVSIEAGLGMYW